MSMVIRLNGEDYVNFSKASVVRSMETVAGAFSFTTTDGGRGNAPVMPIKKGDAIQVVVDSFPVINGAVEIIRGDYSGDSHSLTISGRDITGDFIDSTVTGVKEFTGTTLVDIVRTVLDGLELGDVRVIDEVGVKAFTATEISSAEIGGNAFDFCELFARKRQVLLTTDGLGNVIIARSGETFFPAVIRNIRGGLDNVVERANFTADDTNRFFQYIVKSQLNPYAQEEGVSPQDIATQQSETIIDQDLATRQSRVLTIKAEESSDSFTANDRAAWEMNIRKARGISYTPTIQGHNVQRQVWRPNLLVEVEDDFFGIQSDMLIRGVVYSQDLSEGSTTTLDLTDPKSYSLKVEQEGREANKIGVGLAI